MVGNRLVAADDAERERALARLRGGEGQRVADLEALGVEKLARDQYVSSICGNRIIGGGLSWLGLLKSSIEPALALVVIVPFLPSPGVQPEPSLEEAANDPALPRTPPAVGVSVYHQSPLEQFEHQLKLPVDLGLFFFAFANAGVAFGSINSVTFIVLLSLIAGKTAGVSAFSWVALRLGFPLPTGMDTRHLVVAGLIAGLGLTVALFVASKAFAGPAMSPEAMFLDPAKMGALLSGGVALLALAAGSSCRVSGRAGRPYRTQHARV